MYGGGFAAGAGAEPVTAPRSCRMAATARMGRSRAAFGEQHFSPIGEISTGNVHKLGLAWSMDLPPGNSVSQPLEIDGVLYFCTAYSIIHAVEAASGKELWTFNPKVPEATGKKLAWAGAAGVSPGGTAISTPAHRTGGSSRSMRQRENRYGR